MPAFELHERMSALARDLRSQANPEDTLQHIVDAARELISSCESAGMSLAGRATRTIETSASTDALAPSADHLQQECGEGPCMDAVWEEHVVSSPDLAHESRWPTWGPRAVEELGVRSMVCMQLFTHEDRLGALNMFSTKPHAFDRDDIEEASAIAAQAAVALAAAQRLESLETALHTRSVIGTAIGITMARYGLTDVQSLSVLKRLSSHENRKVATIAAELVAQQNRAREQPPK